MVLICKSLSLLHTRMLYAMFEIGTVVLKKMFKFCPCFSISLLPPLGKGHGPSFEQIWIPFIKGCLLSRLVEIGPVVLEKTHKFCQCFFAILLFSFLGKGQFMSLHLSKLKLTPFTQRCHVQSLVNIGPVVLENKMKMWKVYDNVDDAKHHDANIQILIRNAHLSLQMS